ncbi:MAG: prepilin peptidase [Lachnospiraceae bacterium]
MDQKILAGKVLLLILGGFLGGSIPGLVSFFSRGRCKTKCPAWVFALLNTVLYAEIICLQEFGIRSMLYGVVITALLILAVIDWKICEIPNRLIAVLMVAAVAQTGADRPDIREHLTGFVLMGLPLTILFYLTKGRSLGGGDVKLMAVTGLLMGWEDALTALFVGCILALVHHAARMKKCRPKTVDAAGTTVCKRESALAFGPYLAAGIILMMLSG